MTHPQPDSGLAWCAGCGRLLSAAIEDPDWAGVCIPCVQSGRAIAALRDRKEHNPDDQPR